MSLPESVKFTKAKVFFTIYDTVHEVEGEIYSHTDDKYLILCHVTLKNEYYPFFCINHYFVNYISVLEYKEDEKKEEKEE